MTEYNDYPLAEAAEGAQKKIEDGWTVFQKFTCGGCGSRQTMPDANKFYTGGKCQECGHVTDIRIAGCNYMAVWSSEEEMPDGREISELMRRGLQ